MPSKQSLAQWTWHIHQWFCPRAIQQSTSLRLGNPPGEYMIYGQPKITGSSFVSGLGFKLTCAKIILGLVSSLGKTSSANGIRILNRLSAQLQASDTSGHGQTIDILADQPQLTIDSWHLWHPATMTGYVWVVTQIIPIWLSNAQPHFFVHVFSKFVSTH